MPNAKQNRTSGGPFWLSVFNKYCPPFLSSHGHYMHGHLSASAILCPFKPDSCMAGTRRRAGRMAGGRGEIVFGREPKYKLNRETTMGLCECVRAMRAGLISLYPRVCCDCLRASTRNPAQCLGNSSGCAVKKDRLRRLFFLWKVKAVWSDSGRRKMKFASAASPVPAAKVY